MSAVAQATPFRVDYGPEIEAEIARLQQALVEHTPELVAGRGYDPRWLAIKLLEGEGDLLARMSAAPGGETVIAMARVSALSLRDCLGDDAEVLFADGRYRAISSMVQEVVRRPTDDRLDLTDAIDAVVAHRVLGIPIFLFMMYFIFKLVTGVSAPYLEWVNGVFSGPVTHWAASLARALGAGGGWVESLLVDGVIAGVGSVLSFLPGLLVLYFFLTLMEDSGYMARAAFVMDRLMHFLGLHGKSFIPLVLGFGCAVPAIYATRTLRSRRDRVLTALLIPLMSCSARLPVYVVFGLALFAAHADLLIWAMYALGIAVAVVYGLFLTRVVFRQAPASGFVLELPPYRMPTLRALLAHTWERAGDFVKRAGTVILAASVVLWLLLNIPVGAEPKDSLFGRVSQAVAPTLAPAGFGDWRNTGALVSGLLAKEVIVSALATVHAVESEEAEASGAVPTLGEDLAAIGAGFAQATLDAGKTLVSLIPGVNLTGGQSATQDTALTHALRGTFTPLAALAFVTFVLLYVPCVAALGAIRAEFGARWAVLAAFYQTAIAWALAVAVYQIGRWIGLGG